MIRLFWQSAYLQNMYISPNLMYNVTIKHIEVKVDEEINSVNSYRYFIC